MDLKTDTVALMVNGELKDTSYDVKKTDKIEEISISSDEGLNILRHSASHILAQAVQNLYKDAKIGIGPAVENGYYYDFLIEHNFEPNDLKKIEKEMLKIVNQKQIFRKRTISFDDALKEFKDEPLKIEIATKKAEESTEFSIYENVDKDGNVVWKDFCLGPHIPNTGFLKNFFKLTKISSAYWLGDEKNPALQRIYGIAFDSKEKLKEYLSLLEMAKQRDHKVLGKKLDLYSFPDEIGSGLPIFHPKGAAIKNIMEEYSREKHLEAQYSFVSTPHIAKGKLFNTSGHLSWYKEYMYPEMKPDDRDDNTGDKSFSESYFLKPMNCPMHNLVYKSGLKSYKELPLRLFEFGNVYRYEKSGVVNGLIRARGFTQDDAHIYCTEEQVEAELSTLLKFVLDLLKDFGLDDFYLELSTKDENKYTGSDELWKKATSILENVAKKSKLKLILDEGGAAFYGPKISVQVKDALKRTWQISTIQLDFNLPELFDLKYTDKDGKEKRPIMIHRALFGSIERFLAILVEHYGGAFPFWLSPVQIKCIPVSDANIEYLEKFSDKLKSNNIRFEIDATSERFGKKIANATKEKVPLIVIVGDTDMENKAVSFRYRDGSQKNNVPIDDALKIIDELNAQH